MSTKCPKCELELVDTQKVCPRCGSYTPASGFYYPERKAFVLTKQMKIAAGILGGLLLVLVLYLALRITPPDRVAMDFYKALTERRMKDAQKYVTVNFKNQLADQISDFRDLSDKYYLEASSTSSKPVVSAPAIDDTRAVETAKVSISLVAPAGQTSRQVLVSLVKQGRKWRVDDIN